MLTLLFRWTFAVCSILILLFTTTSASPLLARSPNEASSSTVFRPVSLALGIGPLFPTSKFKSFCLTPSQPFATLDYGSEAAGYPYFTVSEITGAVQFEVKYSEPFSGLAQPLSDGPYPFAVSLSNTYRVETFEATKPGELKAYLIQGGQRWQSIRLLSGGSITFSNVGFTASVSTLPPESLPGSFESDDPLLNDIWKLGAKAATAACVEKGTQKAIWDVSADGVFVRSTRPALSSQGANLKDYTLQFDVKIERAGTGWAVASALTYPNKGLLLDIVGELPKESTFVNTNTSLTPANSILLAYGYSWVNQSTLTSYYLDTFKIPFPVHEHAWYTIKTVLSADKRLAVSINNTKIFDVSLSNYYIGGSSVPTTGSFGFGSWQDQSSTVKNVAIHDSANGSLLYSNPMVNPTTVLGEYGVHENYESVCLDGPKRDRLVWLGDFYHTAKIIGASTSRFDLARGTLQYFLDWQQPNGLLPISPPMGYDPTTARNGFSAGGDGLSDYQVLGLKAFTDYVSQSNDLTWAHKTWAKWQLQTDWILSKLNSTTGLLSFSSAFLGPASGGSAVSCALLETLNNLQVVASAIDDHNAAKQYQTQASNLREAINNLLWNDKLGVYSLSLDSPDDYSVSGLSFCITSGAANATQTVRMLSALPNLKLGPGYKDSSQANSSDTTIAISPNTNGFLLAALTSPNSTDQSSTVLQLLRSLWGAMLSNRETSTGASWEYLDQHGNPGLSLFTSLSHPWGGAPTYILTEYAAGIRQAKGVAGFGYANWVVNPSGGLAMGLRRASAKVVTAYGGNLEVQWSVKSNNTLNVRISAPKKTSGTFEFHGVQKVLSGKSQYSFSVTIGESY
ncbi:glycoside hydrolase family 78 protein [Rhexocercosporidium sp. MPI-PUGE-AT-0058]|nr:glycoside hydrolase family 78 protein [Rhexocercosporidium sp. MPI-PUGE-AT-0058]